MNNSKTHKFLNILLENKVVVLFVLLCVLGTMASGVPVSFVAGELFTRIGRNSFLVLALIIPVLAGMGLNFGIVIGAIAAQVAVFWVVYWGFSGIGGIGLCVLIATPIAVVLGFLVGKLFNRMKGSEMIGGMVLGYFAEGFYLLYFLFIIGGIIPVSNPTLIISGGVGVKNTIDLKDNLKYALDTVPMLTIVTVACYLVAIVTIIGIFYKKSKQVEFSMKAEISKIVAAVVVLGLTFVPPVTLFLSSDRLILTYAIYLGVAVALIAAVIRFKKLQKSGRDTKPAKAMAIGAILVLILGFLPPVFNITSGIKLPVLTYVCIATLCLFNSFLMRTRLGQNMRTVGQNRTVANSAGINVDRTRIIAMILSTVFACWGQIIYLQNMGTFSTYGAHTQVGQFAIAALLVGGASVHKATNKQAIIGIILFHTLFIVAPLAGKNIFGNAQIGEYFRVFVAYGVIAVSLAMHAWKTHIKTKEEPVAE